MFSVLRVSVHTLLSGSGGVLSMPWMKEVLMSAYITPHNMDGIDPASANCSSQYTALLERGLGRGYMREIGGGGMGGG